MNWPGWNLVNDIPGERITMQLFENDRVARVTRYRKDRYTMLTIQDHRRRNLTVIQESYPTMAAARAAAEKFMDEARAAAEKFMDDPWVAPGDDDSCTCGHDGWLHTPPHRQYTLSGKSYWKRNCNGIKSYDTLTGSVPCRCTGFTLKEEL